MKKTLYICGDSFCTEDLIYGPSWVSLIKNELSNISVINLASPGASNYLISLQVQYALDNKCDYLIYHATSSIRNEFSICSADYEKDNINRYWAPIDQDNKCVLSTSWINATRNTGNLLSKNESDIKKFFTLFVDFPSMVGKNYIFICYTLQMIRNKLKSNQWGWSRGGFEHSKFKNSNSWDFDAYTQNESNINLWDDYDNTIERPYYHVTNIQIHQKVCKHYIDMLNLHNV